MVGFAATPYLPERTDPMLEPWRMKHVELLDGLGVACVDEAADGSLWFGTVGGIVHYDGLTVTRIPFDEHLRSLMPQEESELIGRAITVARDGRLFLIVDNSFVSYSDGTWEVHLSGLATSWHPEDWLCQADDGTVFVQAAHRIVRFSEDLKEKTVVLRVPQSIRITTFAVDEKYGLWATLNEDYKGTLLYIPVEDGQPADDTLWQRFEIPVKRTSMPASLAIGGDGRVWYVDSFPETGILCFDSVEGTWEERREGSGQGHYSIHITDDGTVLVGGYAALCSVRDDIERVYSASELGLPSVRLVVNETSDQRLWIIGEFLKVYSIDSGPDRWQTFPDLNFQCETPDGVQWFIRRNGDVVSFTRGTEEWLAYDEKNGVIDSPVVLVASSDGLIWAAGSHEGIAALSVYDGERWQEHSFPELAAGIGYRSGFEDSEGYMWFGASGDEVVNTIRSGGAIRCRVDDAGCIQVIKHYASPEIPFRIAGFAETPDGVFWIGASVIHYLEDGATDFSKLESLPFRWTDQLTVDQNGLLWIAKGGFGVFSREDDGWKNFKVADGLASDMVSCLLPLQDGTLLAGTDAGISRFDGVSWTPRVFAEGFSLGREDGTLRQSNDEAIWVNYAGRSWYFRNELLKPVPNESPFHAVRYVGDKHPPETEIVDYLERVSQPGNALISWSARDLWENTPQDLLQFSWRLNGGEWSPFVLDTQRTFLGLPHGRHILEVRSRDQDFNIDPAPASIAFTVVAPLFLQPWFLLMILVLIGGSVAFVLMLIHFQNKGMLQRQRHLEEVDQLKTSFFTNISHELRTPLTVIRGPLDRLLRTEEDEEKKQMLSVALRNADRVSTLVTQLLDFRKLERGRMRMDMAEGDIAACVSEVVELLQPVATQNNVICGFQCLEECIGWFDQDKLKKIAHNLVNNAVKYTGSGGAVEVSLMKVFGPQGERILKLVVEDDGAGIEPEHLERIFERFYRVPEKSIVDGSGIGLHLTKELVALWGGEIKAESPIADVPEHPGTRFTVFLPIGYEQTRADGVDDG